MRGKQISPEKKAEIITAWAVTENYSEVSRMVDVPVTTVRKIVLENKDKDEFEKLCKEKKEEFADKATGIIDKALNRLEEMLDDPEKEIPANQLTTVIGTLYDKRALDQGKTTNNLAIEIKLPEGAEEYAK